MPRNDLLVRIAAAIVGIVAIAFAAATIESPTDPGGSGGVGEGEGGGFSPPDQPVEPGANTGVPPFLEYLGLLLLVVTAIVVAWYLVKNRRDVVKTVAVYLAIFALVIGLVWLLTEFAIGPPEPPENATPPETPNQSGGDGLGPDEGTETETFPFSIGPVLLVLGLVAAIFGGVFVLSRRDPSPDDSGMVASEPDDDAAAIGAAAGRAADRIDESAHEDVDNAVYRAWREMTRHLDVERPETSTPGEFASAAIAAGLEREHVGELTQLFEEVRYGDAETTEKRERRAEAVLRRIESAYADDGEDGDSSAAGERGGDRR